MLRSTIRTRCETRFRDTGNNIYSDAEWNDYILDAEAMVYAASPYWPFHQTRNTALVVLANTGSVALPDATRIDSVFNSTDNYLLQPLDGNVSPYLIYPDFETTRSQPDHYRFWDGSLEVYPWPSSDTTLYVDYRIAPPLDNGDTAEPAFPEVYHRILVPGALALAYEDDGNFEMARAQQERFEAGIQRMINDLLAARGESYPALTDAWGWA